ncbi:hypothetical protein ACHAW6_000595 [Cyclotella cf. meneghiniana]
MLFAQSSYLQSLASMDPSMMTSGHSSEMESRLEGLQSETPPLPPPPSTPRRWSQLAC